MSPPPGMHSCLFCLSLDLQHLELCLVQNSLLGKNKWTEAFLPPSTGGGGLLTHLWLMGRHLHLQGQLTHSCDQDLGGGGLGQEGVTIPKRGVETRRGRITWPLPSPNFHENWVCQPPAWTGWGEASLLGWPGRGGIKNKVGVQMGRFQWIQILIKWSGANNMYNQWGRGGGRPHK